MTKLKQFLTEYGNTLQAFQRGIPHSDKSNRVVLFGEGTYFHRKFYERIVSANKDIGKLTFATDNLHQDDLNALGSQALFESARIVQIHHPGTAQYEKNLFAVLSRLTKGENCILTITKSKLSKSLSEKLKKLHFNFLDCYQMSDDEIVDVISLMGLKVKCSLSNAACRELLGLKGSDLFAIESEVMKLANYYSRSLDEKDKVISDRDVRNLIPIVKTEISFRLSNLLLEDKSKEAMIFLEKQILNGENELALLGIFTYHFQTAYKLKLAKNRRQKSEFSSFVQRKYAKYIDSQSADNLLSKLAKCCEIDILLKSTRVLDKPRLFRELILT